MPFPTPDIAGKRQFLTAPTLVTITSGTSTLSGTLGQNAVYSVTSDVDCFFLQGGASSSATANSVPLWARERASVFVGPDGSDQRIAVFASSAGTLYITKME